MESMRVEYWWNANLTSKFGGYLPTDDLVLVGMLEAIDLDDAFRKCNRIDEPVPMLDEAKAPSMSVGDVIYVVNNDEWFSVASFGFDRIAEPDSKYRLEGRTVSDVIAERY